MIGKRWKGKKMNLAINFQDIHKNNQEKLSQHLTKNAVYCHMDLLDIQPDGSIQICVGNNSPKKIIGNIYSCNDIEINKEQIITCKTPGDLFCLHCFNNAVSNSKQELKQFLKESN